ncbi:MAG: putative porin [Methylophilaceae bacterium]
MNNKKSFKLSLMSLALMSSCLTTPMVQAGERESLEQLRGTTVNLINLLVQEGVLSKDKAEGLLKQAAQDAARSVEKLADSGEADAKSDGKAVRVQYVPEHIKNEMREEIKKDVMAKLNYKAGERLGLPDWIDRIQWEGDIRLRYEKDVFPLGNVSPQYLPQGMEDITNTSENRDRWRVRARLGAKLKISDYVTGGIRFTTGNAADPISPNQTLGDNYQTSSKFNFGLDRAYLKITPVSWASVSGGRIENPWLGTDLVWDPDLAFDGAVANVRPKFGDNFTAFATVGAFPIQEVQTTKDSTLTSGPVAARDKWLYGAQVGFEWKSPDSASFKLGLAYYDFSNVQGLANPSTGSHIYDLTARQLHQKGNTVFNIDDINGGSKWGLASQFREVNLTGVLDIANFNPVHVVLTGDYVKNIGFNRRQVQANVDSSLSDSPVGGDTAWMVKLQVGMPETYQRYDWNAFAAYKRLESNSVMDAYTDSDFHLGGTNTKGWLVGGNFGVDKNTWLTLRWFSADVIAGPAYSADVLLLDLNAKF